MQTVIAMAVDDIGSFQKESSSQPELAPDTHKATPPETMQLFNGMIQQYPPVPLLYPDGTVRVVSPWVAALEFVREGPEELEQVQKILTTAGVFQGGM